MYSYILPTIISLPLGYNCRIYLPFDGLMSRLHKKFQDYEIIISLKAFREKNIFFEKKIIINKKSTLKNIDFLILDQQDESKFPGYAELEIFETNKKMIFSNRAALNFYSIYFKRDKKSFLSDNAYKFGSPTAINQMSIIKKYLDAYPTITIDKKKDMGETLVMINPYPKDIVGSIITNDGRSLSKIKVRSLSCKEINLKDLMSEKESFWQGHIQIRTSNRVITFNYKHSYQDNKVISDYEHLDPYRSEPTFLPSFQLLRIKIGKLFKVFNF
jgi:hypothetical protein